MENEEDPLIDAVVGNRYHVVRKLGEGAMSVVYEAKHVKLHRSFALKRLLSALSTNAEALKRFEREAEMLAGLRHPNVVEISDWETLPDGAPCMILEFLHGAQLATRLARGPQAWDAIARIGDQVMSALALAHRNGITHRDLKPDNIFMAIDDVGDERVKLLDFGVSKLRGVGAVTAMFAMLGTPSYMSPEQAMGNSDAVGPSTDVWAMGAILYEMATGRVAFKGEGIADTLMMITDARPDPIAAFRRDATPAFVELLDRAMSLDPVRRILTIEELRVGLREALDPRNQVHRLHTPVAGVPLMVPPAPRPQAPTQSPAVVVAPKPPKPDRRRTLGLALVFVVAAIAATIVVVLALRS